MIYLLAGAIFSIVALGTMGVALLVVADKGARRAFLLAIVARLAKIYPPRFAILGDSLAAQCDWRSLGRRPLDVVALAVGGATIKEIGGQVLQARTLGAKTLVIDGGLNDLLFDEASTEEIERDFRALFRRIGPDTRAIVTLMPYIRDPEWSARIDDANRAIRARADERGFAVVDLNARLCEHGARKREMTDDGLHFSPLACAIFVEAVRDAAAGGPISRAAPPPPER